MSNTFAEPDAFGGDNVARLIVMSTFCKLRLFRLQRRRPAAVGWLAIRDAMLRGRRSVRLRLRLQLRPAQLLPPAGFALSATLRATSGPPLRRLRLGSSCFFCSNSFEAI